MWHNENEMKPKKSNEKVLAQKKNMPVSDEAESTESKTILADANPGSSNDKFKPQTSVESGEGEERGSGNGNPGPPPKAHRSW